MMVKLRVYRISYVIQAKILFGLIHALTGKRCRPGLYIHHIVAALLLLSAFKQNFRSCKLLYIGPAFQFADKAVDFDVHIRRFLAVTGNYKRGSRLVDQDRVNLVNYSIIEFALNHALPINHHIVAQVVETEFIIRSIYDIARVYVLALRRLKIGSNTAHGKAKKAVYLAHPLRIALCQIVVYRYNMNTLSIKRV